MKASEIIYHVLENGITLVRVKKVEHVKGTPFEYDVKSGFTGKKKGWVWLDTFTASAMKAIYEVLNPESQEKYDCLPLTAIINFTWKHIK